MFDSSFMLSLDSQNQQMMSQPRGGERNRVGSDDKRKANGARRRFKGNKMTRKRRESC